MAPKITRKDGNEASKDSDQLNSKAETEVETVAMTEADEEDVSAISASERNAKRCKGSSTKDAYRKHASTSGVPSHGTSAASPTAKSEVAEAVRSDSIGDGDGDMDAGGKIGGGAMNCCSGGAAGEASSMHDSAAHSEPSVNTYEATESTSPILGSDDSNSMGDATVAVAAAATYKSVISGMARANESNPIREENYYLLHWLYRIRRVGCARGLRIGFLQPDFLWTIYRPMMRSKKLQRTDEDIKEAVDVWCSNRAEGEEQYGDISEWDVSSVTYMGELFRGKREFNDDISRWDVSNVTSMRYMFCDARSFNQYVGDWDVSYVTDMYSMFYGVYSFNQPVGNWDVSNVTDMSYMFCEARSFNQPIGDWDVSSVNIMYSMFYGAYVFDQPVGDWDVSSVFKMADMFCQARAFNQDLTRWDMRSVRHMRYTSGMFNDAPAMQRGNKPAGLR